VVDRGDLPGLVSAIATVRKAGKQAYTGKCRKWAEDRFDKDARFGEYLDLYREALKKKLKTES
jgi:putative colanic acid biosynthesis glycosyltransferase